MSKLLRVFMAVILVLWSVPVIAEIIDVQVPINVSVEITGEATLTLETRNVSDDTLVSPSAIQFTGAGAVQLPPAGNPWIVADQYIRLVYSSNHAVWGIRIVTDNEDLENDQNDIIDKIVGNSVAPGPDGIWGTSDDVKAYSGLLGLNEISKPVNSRYMLLPRQLLHPLAP